MVDIAGAKERLEHAERVAPVETAGPAAGSERERLGSPPASRPAEIERRAGTVRRRPPLPQAGFPELIVELLLFLIA